jgi:hypothetical protein
MPARRSSQFSKGVKGHGQGRTAIRAPQTTQAMCNRRSQGRERATREPKITQRINNRCRIRTQTASIEWRPPEAGTEVIRGGLRSTPRVRVALQPFQASRERKNRARAPNSGLVRGGPCKNCIAFKLHDAENRSANTALIIGAAGLPRINITLRVINSAVSMTHHVCPASILCKRPVFSGWNNFKNFCAFGSHRFHWARSVALICRSNIL